MKENFYIPQPRTHLDLTIPGAKPIFASVVGLKDDFEDLETWEKLKDYRETVNAELKSLYEKFSEKDILEVDWEGKPDKLKEQGILNGGRTTYVISPVDGRSKFSKEIYDCTGLIVAGLDKETGENISFTTHQDPKEFLHDDEVRKQFIADLEKRLAEIKERCKPNTIDAVMVGGLYRKYLPDFNKTFAGHKAEVSHQKNYLDSLKLVGEITKKFLGFEPTVVNGPKTHQPDAYIFENKDRRLYLIRPYLNQEAGDFPTSDADKDKDDWISGNF